MSSEQAEIDNKASERSDSKSSSKSNSKFAATQGSLPDTKPDSESLDSEPNGKLDTKQSARESQRKKQNTAKQEELSSRVPIKILCISDDVDLLIYSNGIEERFRHIDFVLSAGDLYFNYYNYIVSMLNKPLYFVFGNHNLKHLGSYRKAKINDFATRAQHPESHPASGGTYIGDKVVYIKKHNLIIAGLGGCKRYSNGANQFSELQMGFKILRLWPRLLWNRLFRGRYLDILLTHAAPEGINDRDDPCHKGFKTFLWFMRRFRPRYLLHGHIHLYDINSPRKASYKDTQVINVYSRYELEIENKQNK